MTTSSTAPWDDRVALVTGGASGIGRATALALAAEGARIAVADRDGDGAEATATEATRLGPLCVPYTIDLSDLGAIVGLVDGVIADLGRIDVLVNCAGISGVHGETQRLLDYGDDTFDAVMAINLRAPFALTRAVAAHMAERGGGGRIVNVSSSASFQARAVPAIYAASKAGLNALTRVSAAELAPHGINVNAVAPGVTKTAIMALPDEAVDLLVSSGPFENLTHRASMPEDVASVIGFLCCEASREITGQVINTSAGLIV